MLHTFFRLLINIWSGCISLFSDLLVTPHKQWNKGLINGFLTIIQPTVFLILCCCIRWFMMCLLGNLRRTVFIQLRVHMRTLWIMIWKLYNIVRQEIGIVFGRLRISCGELVTNVFLREFDCKQKVFSVLISARCVKAMVKIILICFLYVVNVCFVCIAPDYVVLWWLPLILLQVSQQVCLLSFNISISSSNKSLVWLFGVSGSI